MAIIELLINPNGKTVKMLALTTEEFHNIPASEQYDPASVGKPLGNIRLPGVLDVFFRIHLRRASRRFITASSIPIAIKAPGGRIRSKSGW